MNLYYLTDKATFEDNIQLFHPKLGAHYIDLPNGQILLSASFPESHYEQDAWESLGAVQSMPNPSFQATQPITDAQVAALQAVLTPTAPAQSASQQLAAPSAPSVSSPAPNPTVLDVATAVAQINPLMKLRAF